MDKTLMDRVAIKASDITQSFTVGERTVPVLKQASFEIEEQSFTVIYGPSGSGKSTLLNILTGLQPPTTGEVEFDGLNVYGMTPDELAHFRANSIGFVYQQNFWVHSLNVLDNVAMPLYFLGYSRTKALKKARQMLKVVGMGKAANRYPSFLSSGEQQRVAMARAIINNPKYIVADEPTGSLDSTNGDRIMELLRHSQEDLGHTIMLVTHNMEYLSLADNLLHIHDGRVRQTPKDTIKATTDGLVSEMKKRIDALAASKRHKVPQKGFADA